MESKINNPKTFAPEFTDSFSSREEAIALLENDRYQYTSKVVSTADFSLNEDYQLNKTIVTDFGFQNYMGCIGIPNVFVKRIPIDLLIKNQDKLKTEFERPLRVFTRKSDGAIVNFSNPDFRPVSTRRVLERIPDAFITDRNNATEKSYINTRNMKLLFDVPIGDVIEPEVGDVIKFGKMISNSETGFGSLSAALMTYRLACSNGAIMGNEWGRVVRRQNGKLNEEQIVENFFHSYETLLPDTSKMAEAFKIMKNEHPYIDEVVNIYNYLFKIFRGIHALPEHSKEDIQKIDLKIADTLKLDDIKFDDIKEKIDDRRKALKNPMQEIPEREKHETLSYYNLFNRVTELPHHIRHNVKATNQIEILGGNIINSVIKNYNSQFVSN
jgi:hypothetical protein